MNSLIQNPSRKQRIVLFWGIALVLSLVLALTVYIWFFQTSTLAKREYAFAFLLWLIFAPLVFLLLNRFLLHRLEVYSPKTRRNWVLISIGIGILLTLVTHPPQTILLQPVRHLQINLPGSSVDRIVTLEYAKTSLRDIGFGEFRQKGDWQRTDAGFTHTGGEPASLTWSGRTGEKATLVFSNTPGIEEIQSGWDGNLSALAPAESPAGPVIASSDFGFGWLSAGMSWILVTFTYGFLFLILALFVVEIQIKPAPKVAQKKGYWLLYALPMIVVWGIFLLTFWPGMMSPDSNNQWSQAVTGQFDDMHPVFHTLLLWLLMHIWYSPASVVVFQIITLSLTIAWGIRILDEEGLPRWAGWSLAFIFTLAPLNGYTVVTLWKDIPYSTSLYLFSLMILKIFLSNGQWLNKKLSWVWLGLVSMCIAGFRHNGVPIPLITLPLMIFAYKNYWKQLLKSTILFLVLILLYWYPGLNLLHADRNFGYKQLTLVHHIAAHIVTGGELNEIEKQQANSILPLNEWKYSCCYNIDIFRAESYSDERLSRNIANIQSLFLDLSIKEPQIEINHILCSGSLVWEFPHRCGTFLLPLTPTEWIAPNGSFFTQDSKIPNLEESLSKLIITIRSDPNLSFVISPAISLYISIFTALLFMYRKRDSRAIYYLFPTLIQSVIIFFTSPSQDYRYQYGVYLIGLFSFGLILLSLITPVRNIENKNGSFDKGL